MLEEENLFGEDFPIDSQEDTIKLLRKAKEPKKAKSKKVVDPNLALHDKLLLIAQEVNRILGRHREDTLTVKDIGCFSSYIDSIIENGICALDTETNNSLDPHTCKLMGLCLYTNGQKQAYIPCNHVDLFTGERLPWQISERQIREQLQRLLDANVKIVYHNASFDIRVIQCTCGIELGYIWDSAIAAKILNENESAKLKDQYQMHVDPTHAKYDIESLFQRLPYAIVDPDLFALYAATDPMMTFKLYEYQLREFMKPDNKDIYDLYLTVELPCIQVVKDMELEGIEVDLDYCKRIQDKYHGILDGYDEKIQSELDKLMPRINEWRSSPEGQAKVGKKTKAEQLSDPINLDSTTQLAIIVYDILKVPTTYGDKSPRSVDKNTIPLILEDYDIPLLQVFNEKKVYQTLVQNFLDKIPELVNKDTNRVYCSFNQVGTVTGRFSCSDPNLQQIPSKNHEVRLMFKARDGYTLVGNDWSQQEPRLLAFYSQDEDMIRNYVEGKDLYALIATKVYHNKYEDNLEFNPLTGKRSEEGAKRRSACKQVQLAISYGMSTKSLANKIDTSEKDAQKIIDDFYKGFAGVRKWTDETIEFAHKHGYVVDWHGRRRRLPTITLPKYSIKLANSDEDANFNPFIGCSNREIDEESLNKYQALLEKAKWWKDVKAIKERALGEGILISSNNMLISRAERQCVNARIQGGAATMTKVAMIKIYHDKELRDLGFKLLIGVHDELIGECPKENGERCAERLAYLMRTCISDICNVPFKSDAYVVSRWYEDVYKSSLEKELHDLIDKNNLTKEEAFDKLSSEHTETLREDLASILGV